MSQDMLQLQCKYINDIVAPSKISLGQSHAGSSVFFVKEMTGKMHLVVDYHSLNTVTIHDKYLIPYILAPYYISLVALKI